MFPNMQEYTTIQKFFFFFFTVFERSLQLFIKNTLILCNRVEIKSYILIYFKI